ncbi:acetate/propionate family kinase [Methylocystis sp. H62]|uniref:acetate/propionate family kinase n=1 Tax=Methylocystis sp. H62 TaxID=2785789 RepID=UPI0018C21DDD|nr:acetate/propionate family kinase [Methylocystis sp. H62]MBG0793630.1 acetate/propionate family kinase [Methylocystis sp. H62]
MADRVVTLNAGSSSVKFALFAADADWPRLIASGAVEGLGAKPRFRAAIVDGEISDKPLAAKLTHKQAIAAIFEWIEDAYPLAAVSAIGHRVVHGGLSFAAPVIVDAEVLAELRELIPLAPLHQPHNLAGIEGAKEAFPHVPQVACFDTAFHRGHAFVDDAYALPYSYYERGLRRFGFHGLSYEYISRRLRMIDPIHAEGGVIVAHLGNGASLCAMKGGRSIAASMGFSALEGLPMGTRCGQIDPGLLLYLLRSEGMTPEELSHLLYERSGLLGLSGVSHDMRTLEASKEPRAQAAIGYFIHRIKMEIAALAAAIGGFDALVFTAGIGEHSPRVRAGVVEGLGWLGLTLDAAANARNDLLISAPQSRVPVFVTPTDEESMIARHTIETAGLTAAAK